MDTIKILAIASTDIVDTIYAAVEVLRGTAAADAELCFFIRSSWHRHAVVN